MLQDSYSKVQKLLKTFRLEY